MEPPISDLASRLQAVLEQNMLKAVGDIQFWEVTRAVSAKVEEQLKTGFTDQLALKIADAFRAKEGEIIENVCAQATRAITGAIANAAGKFASTLKARIERDY